jgi:hypothetical protein
MQKMIDNLNANKAFMEEWLNNISEDLPKVLNRIDTIERKQKETQFIKVNLGKS